MASFYIACNTCLKKLLKKIKPEKREYTVDEYEAGVLFETEYSMNATEAEIKEAMICPRCNGTDCEKTFYGYNNISYIRGNGFLDKAGCQRDMHLHHLNTNDPYGHMRVPGEVEDLKVKLKRAGQHNPKAKHFSGDGKGMEAAVTKAVTKPSSSE